MKIKIVMFAVSCGIPKMKQTRHFISWRQTDHFHTKAFCVKVVWLCEKPDCVRSVCYHRYSSVEYQDDEPLFGGVCASVGEDDAIMSCEEYAMKGGKDSTRQK